MNNPFTGLSPETAKKRYRDLAKIYHPDKPTGSTEAMQEIMMHYNCYILDMQRDNCQRNTGFTDAESYYEKYKNSIPDEVLQFIESDPVAARMHQSITIALQYLDNRAAKKVTKTNTMETLIKVVSIHTPPESTLGQILNIIKNS